MNKLSKIQGSGGSRRAKEAPNSLRSNSTFRTVHIVSEGEIDGIVGGLKGVQFDNTPVQNPDNSFNFNGVQFETRNGTVGQDYLAGFPLVESVLPGSPTIITYAAPVIRNVNADMDAVRVTIRLPMGLFEQNTKNGDINGFRAGLAIDVQPVGGSWTTPLTRTINGKTNTAFEQSFRVEKPAGAAGAWNIRVRRTNQESTKSNIVDQLQLFVVTGLQDVKTNYDGTAVAGITFDAESTGGSLPSIAFLTKGLIIKVPSNYTPATIFEDGSINSFASYNGVWDGTFKYAWTHDPAWIVYDLLTNTTYGLGDIVPAHEIDIYSFIEWSKYNIQPVSDYQGGLIPRYTFNYPIQSREDAWKVIQMVAGSAQATLSVTPGQIRVIQDRPQYPVTTITNKHVVDGEFTYTSSLLSDRHTACDITFFDRTDNYNQKTITEQADQDLIDRFGFRKLEINGIGIVEEGHARRMAKWAWYTTQVATDLVTFRVALDGNVSFGFGEVINIADNFAANAMVSGQVNHAELYSGNTFDITLDRMLWNLEPPYAPISNGTQLSIKLFDGQEIIGTMTNITTDVVDELGEIGSVTCRWTPVIGSPVIDADSLTNTTFIIVSQIEPRQFKVVGINRADTGVWEVQAAEYDINKYIYIEDGILIDPPQWTMQDNSVVGQPQNLTPHLETYTTPDGIIKLRLRLTWDEVANAATYRVRWRRENTLWQWTEVLQVPEYRIDDVSEGIFEYSVFAYNLKQVQSPPADGWYMVERQEGNPSPLGPVTGLGIEWTGSDTFTNDRFTFVWTPPAPHLDATLRDYKIEFKHPNTGTVLKTVYTTDTSYFVTRADVIAMGNIGGASALTGSNPGRNIPVTVTVRDTLERLSVGASRTFMNPAPAAPTVTFGAEFNSYTVSINAQPANVSEVLVFHSLNPLPATPYSASLLAYQGNATTQNHIVPAIATGTYNVSVAITDVWSNADLIYTTPTTVTPVDTVIGLVLDPPSGITHTSTPNGGSVNITLPWPSVTNATSYKIELSNITPWQQSVQMIDVAASGGAMESYTFTTTAGFQFSVRIFAISANAASNWSGAYVFTAGNDAVPVAAPTGLTVKRGVGTCYLTWTSPPDLLLAGFRVYRNTIPSGTGTLKGSVYSTPGAPITFFNDSDNIVVGTNYYYRLVPFDISFVEGTSTPWVLAEDLVGTVIAGVMLANGSILANHMTANSVSAGAIQAGAITTNKLAANAVTADKADIGSLMVAFVDAGSIHAKSVDADDILAGTLRSGVLIADSANIANGVIGTAHIQNGSITNAKIGGDIQSTVFNSGVNGWIIRRDGTAEFNDVTVRGTMTADSIVGNFQRSAWENVGSTNITTTNATTVGGSLSLEAPVALQPHKVQIMASIYFRSISSSNTVILLSLMCSYNGGSPVNLLGYEAEWNADETARGIFIAGNTVPTTGPIRVWVEARKKASGNPTALLQNCTIQMIGIR